MADEDRRGMADEDYTSQKNCEVSLMVVLVVVIILDC